jgi:putative NADPH-quinone reductase
MNRTKKKILILDFHPDKESFCSTMAEKYIDGANKSGFKIKKITIRDLNFDNVLHFGYRQAQELEPDLVKVQEEIKWSEHLVIVTPVWWGTLPSLAKGFIDRTFIAGFSHRFDPVKKLPEGLLKNKTATVLYTQGSPFFYSFLQTRDAFWNNFKWSILDFCGFKNVKRKCFDKVKSGTDKDRQTILENLYKLGMKGF